MLSGHPTHGTAMHDIHASKDIHLILVKYFTDPSKILTDTSSAAKLTKISNVPPMKCIGFLYNMPFKTGVIKLEKKLSFGNKLFKYCVYLSHLPD